MGTSSDDRVVGYRFYPTEEELLCYHLPNKLNGKNPKIDTVIPLVHIYDYNPWDLPKLAGEACRADTGTEQWFFFTPKQEREHHGGRPNRLTGNGYWKATGSPSDVYTCQSLRVGRKKTLVFYEGRAPTGTKTAWKMNEYKLYEANHDQDAAHPQLKEELSLCRIYKRAKCTRMFERRPQTAAAALDQEAAQYYQQYQSQNTSDEAAMLTSVNNQQNPAVEENGFGWGIGSEDDVAMTQVDIVMLLDCFDI